MPPPFPGMDPFIESQRWEDFHSRMIGVISDILVPQLRPRYTAMIEERVYLEHEIDNRDHIRPDLTIIHQDIVREPAASYTVPAAPITITLPMPEEVTERFLTIRRPGEKDVVTVIELLSPTNKRPNSDGRRHYLNKRVKVLESRTHLVEIDLLRGGQRMPADPKLQGFDYFAVISHRKNRPRAEAHRWNLGQPLPELQIPLDESDPEVELDLQAALTTVYDRAGYDYSLDYKTEILPPLNDDDAAWAREILLKLSSA